MNNLSDPEDVVVPLPDTQYLTSFCVNIKVLSSGYKLTGLSGYEVLITLTVTIWLQRQMVFPNVIILSFNNIDYYYLATNVVSKCAHMYILSTIDNN